jgi:hypothetical protein
VEGIVGKKQKTPSIPGVGLIDIQVDKPFYTPGDVVQGKVLINI